MPMRATMYMLIAWLLSLLPSAALADDRSRCEALNADGPIRIRASLVPAGFAVPKSYYPAGNAMLHFGAGSADGKEPPAGKVDQAFCRIEGVAPTAIRFEVWLPVGGWNGRLLGVGNGAMAGAIPYPAIRTGLAAGYAVVGSDLGHQGGFTDSRFAIGHPELLVDWGYRANHVMTVEARRAVAAFYGRAPSHAYFAGCSGGGRQALMSAQRYPADYDGILAGDPIINFTRLTMAGRLWAQLAMMREANGAGYIPAAKIPTIAKAVVDACDRLDGVADGVIGDPRACRFDPARIRCRAGDGPQCLTTPQVAALRKIYAGAHDGKGRLIFPGYSPGGELGPGGWASYLSGDGPYRGGGWTYPQGVLPSLLYADPDWDMRRIDYDRDVERALALPILGEPMGKAIDAYDPDLTAFAAHGGKLIHYHGWSDPGVPPMNSVRYYQDVLAHVGRTAKLAPAAALARTQGFYRLFMVPGMQHCTGGPGPDLFDALTPLRAWVEQKRAPGRILASHAVDGRIDDSRPLCPFPQVARWTGKGSTREAANFACGSGK
jgi:feruloyl esterase